MPSGLLGSNITLLEYPTISRIIWATSPMLAIVAPTCEDPRDLRDRICLVRGLECSAEERLLANGLRREFRIDARASDEEQLGDLRHVRRLEYNWMARFSRMKSAGDVSFARMPPTFAAAKKT